MAGDRRDLARLLSGGHSVASTENLPRPAHQPVDAVAMASVDLIGDHQLRLVAERDAMPQPGSRARHRLLALPGCSCARVPAARGPPRLRTGWGPGADSVCATAAGTAAENWRAIGSVRLPLAGLQQGQVVPCPSSDSSYSISGGVAGAVRPSSAASKLFTSSSPSPDRRRRISFSGRYASLSRWMSRKRSRCPRV